MATVDFAAALRTLEQYYGPLPALLPKAIRGDPFALVLWEQVAYLATDATRAEAFAALTRRVGLTPNAILDAPGATLERVCRIGGSIAFADRAERMRTSARIVIAKWDWIRNTTSIGLQRTARGGTTRIYRGRSRLPRHISSRSNGTVRHITKRRYSSRRRVAALASSRTGIVSAVGATLWHVPTRELVSVATGRVTLGEAMRGQAE